MRYSKELKVGIFAVLTITILYFGFNYLKGVDFLDKTKTYYTVYDNAGGLEVSNPVSISGFSVGRVTGIEMIQGDSNKVVVAFDIKGDIILGPDAKAILDIGLLGETAITLESGNINKPLQDGDTIEAELGKGITEVISNLATPVAQNLTSTIIRVNRILDSLGGSSNKVRAMIDNLEITTEEIKGMAEETRRNLNAITQDGYLHLLPRETIDSLNARISDIKPLLEEYTELADSLKKIDIQPTLDAAERTLTDVDSVIAEFKNSNGTIKKLMEEDSVYNSMVKTMSSLDSLLIHIRARPKDFFRPLGRDKPKGIPKD